MINNLTKNIPNPNTYNTVAPDMDYVYFDNHNDYPFEPMAEDYSPTNAWWLADASFLAYCHPGYVRMAFYIAGFTEFKFFNGPGTECMVAMSETSIIISFRGTEINSSSVFHEMESDINAKPIPFPEGGNVHKGFFLALEEVWEEKGTAYREKYPRQNSGLKNHLTELQSNFPNKPMWICGHSLGGALATLCFSRLPKAKGLYIYGSPKVGDQDFISILENRQVFRIEHARDPIPLVPPEIPSLGFYYKDTGPLIYINRKGEQLDAKPVLESWSENKSETQIQHEENQRELEIVSSWNKLPVNVKDLGENIDKINNHIKESFKDWSSFIKEAHNEFRPRVEDHMPIYYATKLWNILINS